MNTQERKLQQRIARRKEKVLRQIEEEENRLAALDSVTYLRHEDYLHDKKIIKSKLYRLKEELKNLESGRLQWQS